MQPLEWQTVPITSLSKRLALGESALDASDTGTGKTYVALAAAKAAGMPVAVICPKSTIPSWHETLAAVGQQALFVKNIEALKTDGEGFLCRERRQWKWIIPIRCVMVFDEVHRFAAPDSDNAKILAAAPRPVLMLSATAAQDATKLRAIGHQLRLTTWDDWWPWCGRHGCKRGHFGGLEFRGTQEHLDALHRQIFATGRGVRVRISELGDRFPRVSHYTTLVPVEDQDAVDAAYAAELEQLKTGVPITDLLRARQIAEHEKLAAMMEMAEDDVATGLNVAFFVQFRDSLERLQKQFACPVIHGDQTAEERKTAVAAFESARTIAVMAQAGGCGLDGLQDLVGEHPRVGYFSPGYSAVEARQVAGRLPRGNSKTHVTYKWCFAEGTVEEDTRRKVERKLRHIDTLNDGDLTPSPMKNEPAQSIQGPAPGAGDLPNHTPPKVLPCQPVVSGPGGGEDGASPARRDPPASEQRDHAAVSPSKLKYLEPCPRWVSDDSPAHPVTEAGTRGHTALETGNDSGLQTDAEREAVAKCRAFDKQFASAYPKAFNERKLTVLGDIFGYADRIRLSQEETSAIYIDWKFGWNLQEDAETNPQGQAYALGIFREWPTVKIVNVYFVYPYLDQISHHAYSRADMARIELRLKTIVARVLANTPCTPNVDACSYCGRKATCPQLAEFALPIATRYGASRELDTLSAWDAALITDPVQMSRALNAANVLERWCDSVKRHAIDLRHQQGKEIPGYELRSRAGRAKITSALLAWEVAKSRGLSQEQFLQAVDVSASRLGDVAGDAAPRGQKKQQNLAMMDALRDAGVLETGQENFYLQRTKRQ